MPEGKIFLVFAFLMEPRGVLWRFLGSTPFFQHIRRHVVELFHLLVCLLFDKDVPEREKTKILMAIAYFISPLDLLPELLLGPVAFVDDVAIACFVLNSLMKNVEPEIINRHWAGEDDVLELVEIVVSHGDAWLGSGLFRRIKGFLDKTEKKQK